MGWTHVDVAPRPTIVDPTQAWAQSGAQWLTAPGVGVPVRLMEAVAGLTERLDAEGARLADRHGPFGLGVLSSRASLIGLPPASTVSCGGGSRMVRCRDGWVAATLARPDDLSAVSAWVGGESDDPWTLVRRGAARKPTVDVVERAALLGIPCAAVGEQQDHRDVLARRVGDAPAQPLTGRRVANLASLWAGPLAGDVLARLGADVITVESIERPDGARATPAFFAALHGLTRSVALPFTTERGRAALAELLASVDVVIEGSRPRALEQLGIDATSIVGSGPRIWLSVTGHGRGPGAAHRVAFGDDAAAAGGLCGKVGEQPVFLADAVADPLTGLTAAASVVELFGRGGRWIVDVALSRVAARAAGPAIATDARPQRPSPPGHSCAELRLGEHTAEVLAELGVELP